MKTSLRILLVLISLAVCAAIPSARAADETTTTGKKGHAKKEHAEKANPALTQLQERLQQLDLTADQKAKVDAIIQDSEKANVELRKDKSVSKEDKKAKGRELKKALMEKITAVLTPEQAAKFNARHKGEGKKAKPAAQ
ncbi:MAG: hypothetical protein HZA31_09410 [Opitutae bacterium]|nr:hypothetical protein [Opitutae bacterium]